MSAFRMGTYTVEFNSLKNSKSSITKHSRAIQGQELYFFISFHEFYIIKYNINKK